MPKRSASRNAAFTRSVKRDSLKGGRGRERRSRSSGPPVQLLRRLRRVELALVSILTPGRDFDLDSFVNSVLQLESDAKDDQGRSLE